MRHFFLNASHNPRQTRTWGRLIKLRAFNAWARAQQWREPEFVYTDLVELVGGSHGAAGSRVAVEDAEINVGDFEAHVDLAGGLVEVAGSKHTAVKNSLETFTNIIMISFTAK